MLSKKNKLIIIGIICIVLAGWIVCVIDINRRFPGAVHETYNRDNPVNLNGLEIIPIKNNLYTREELKNKYPLFTHYDDFSESDNDRFVVYEIQITNTIADNIYFQAKLMEAYEVNSCWSNGCFVIEDGMLSPIVKPQETFTLHLTACVGGKSLSARQIESSKCDQFGLTLSYYPKSIVLQFQ